ncbi:endonuclease SmrB, partial [Alishewanella sp. SMS9]|nr:endonuclease SmrB [Alishewanella sp. SMS9]
MQKKNSASKTLDPEELELFREFVAGTRPLEQDKIAPVAKRSKQKRPSAASNSATAEKLFFFSDE